MDQVELKANIAELTATISQQANYIAQLLGKIEEMRQQIPQYPLSFPPLPSACVTPLIGSMGFLNQ